VGWRMSLRYEVQEWENVMEVWDMGMGECHGGMGYGNGRMPWKYGIWEWENVMEVCMKLGIVIACTSCHMLIINFTTCTVSNIP